MVTLRDAIIDLHRRVVIEGATESPRRLAVLAHYCVQQLEQRGLVGVQEEVEVPGIDRPKEWDVAWSYQGKCRLAISLKSILNNISGTVPNRLDDLMGEVANVQMQSPEIVTGYLILFDVSKDSYSKKHACTWGELLQSRLTALSGRKPPNWSTGLIEANCLIRVDFSGECPKLLSDEAEVLHTLDRLVSEVLRRNPAVPHST